MIRPAIPADIERLVAMGQAFFAETGWDKQAEFDIETFAYTSAMLADAGLLFVAVSDGVVGMAGAGISPSWWNKRILVAQELFWYIEPTHRAQKIGLGRALFEALEERVKSLGAVLFSMSAEEGMRSEALARLYRGRGYVPRERLFWKSLERDAA